MNDLVLPLEFASYFKDHDYYCHLHSKMLEVLATSSYDSEIDYARAILGKDLHQHDPLLAEFQEAWIRVVRLLEAQPHSPVLLGYLGWIYGQAVLATNLYGTKAASNSCQLPESVQSNFV